MSIVPKCRRKVNNFHEPLFRYRLKILSVRIALTPSGEDGFGYDPVFYYPRYDKTLAELPPYVKNTISHRSAALQLAAEDIKNR